MTDASFYHTRRSTRRAFLCLCSAAAVLRPAAAVAVASTDADVGARVVHVFDDPPLDDPALTIVPVGAGTADRSGSGRPGRR